MAPAAAAVERIQFESRDMGEVQELISRRYVNHRPRMSGDSRDFRFSSRSVWTDGLTLDRADYRANVSITTEPFETILLLGVHNGVFDITAGRARTVAGPGDFVLYPTHVPLDIVMNQLAYDAVQLPFDLLTKIAARRGVENFRFSGMTPISEAMNRHWRATTAFLSGVFAGAERPQVHPVLLSAVLEAAATAALAVFPNPTMTQDYVRGPGRVAPALVRRATTFIEAHAGEAITLEDIAAAVGIGVRALQAAFRRHLDTTPLRYLYRIRLNRAREELAVARPGDGTTVADVAGRWGFTNPGRFAAAYSSVFGELPSSTLRA